MLGGCSQASAFLMHVSSSAATLRLSCNYSEAFAASWSLQRRPVLVGLMPFLGQRVLVLIKQFLSIGRFLLPDHLLFFSHADC